MRAVIKLTCELICEFRIHRIHPQERSEKQSAILNCIRSHTAHNCIIDDLNSADQIL